MNQHYNELIPTTSSNELGLNGNIEGRLSNSYQFLNLPLNELFSLSFSYYSKAEYETAYSILYNALFRESKIPNLHYNLAKCAYHLDNITLCKYHLRQELAYFNNLKAFNFLDKLEFRNTTPYLTFSLASIFIIIYLVFFQDFSSLDIFLYSLHLDNISITSTITSFFFHSSLIHLFSNIAIFLLIGSFLEQFISKIEYLTILFITGLGSNFLQVISSDEFLAVLGMSGAIFGFFAILALKAPLLSIRIFKIRISILLVALVVYIISVMTMSFQGLQVAHLSHLFGFLIGLGLGVLLNSYLRAKFYALLLFSFGVLLTTSTISTVDPIFFNSFVDLVLAIFLIIFSLTYLKQREQALEDI